MRRRLQLLALINILSLLSILRVGAHQLISLISCFPWISEMADQRTIDSEKLIIPNPAIKASPDISSVSSILRVTLRYMLPVRGHPAPHDHASLIIHRLVHLSRQRSILPLKASRCPRKLLEVLLLVQALLLDRLRNILARSLGLGLSKMLSNAALTSLLLDPLGSQLILHLLLLLELYLYL